MKKILAIFLALIMIMSVALVACSKDKGTTGGSSVEDDDDNEFVAQRGTETSDTEKATTKGWTAANYTVYSMAEGLNVRGEDSTTAAKLGSLKLGEAVVATETNGKWYKITYNGAVAYVSCEYVSASANEATFTNDATPTTLTLAAGHTDDMVNLRVDPVYAEDTLGITYNDKDHKGGTLTKVGQNAEGNWYIVEYDADGEGAGAPVKYYLKMNSSTKAMFGLSTSGANGYS